MRRLCFSWRPPHSCLNRTVLQLITMCPETDFIIWSCSLADNNKVLRLCAGSYHSTSARWQHSHMHNRCFPYFVENPEPYFAITHIRYQYWFYLLLIMKCNVQVQLYWYAWNNKFTVFHEGLWDWHFGAMTHNSGIVKLVGEFLRRWF